MIVDPGGSSQAVLDFFAGTAAAGGGDCEYARTRRSYRGQCLVYGKDRCPPLLIHAEEEAYLADGALNLAHMIRQDLPPPLKADRLLKDGDTIALGTGKLEVLHTPGHSPGSISLYFPGSVICGDTLFKSSVGRWDLPPRGSHAVLQESLLRLARLPLDTVVYPPGHGDSTTIREEIKTIHSCNG